MAIKLIAIDIDGTLLNSKREITPRVKAALNAASAQGVYVVLCTGRPYPGVKGLLQELDLVNDHDYVVTYNGTLVQQTGSKKALVRFSMTHDDLKRVNEYATKYNVHYHAIDEEAIYVPTETVGKYSVHESELVGMPIVHQLYKDIPTDKEFVKIRRYDGEEFQTFQKRIFRAFRFGKNPCVEFYPRQFSVKKNGFLFFARRFCFQSVPLLTVCL